MGQETIQEQALKEDLPGFVKIMQDILKNVMESKPMMSLLLLLMTQVLEELYVK